MMRWRRSRGWCKRSRRRRGTTWGSMRPSSSKVLSSKRSCWSCRTKKSSWNYLWAKKPREAKWKIWWWRLLGCRSRAWPCWRWMASNASIWTTLTWARKTCACLSLTGPTLTWMSPCISSRTLRKWRKRTKSSKISSQKWKSRPLNSDQTWRSSCKWRKN